MKKLEDQNLKVTSDGREIKEFIGYVKGEETKIKCKVSPEGDIREYVSGVPQELIGEQLFTYSAICRLGLEKRLPTFDDIKVLDSSFLAGYWTPNYEKFYGIGGRSSVWLAGGYNADFIHDEWFRHDIRRHYGFSGRLLKELDSPTIGQFDNTKFPIEIRDKSDNEYTHGYIIARDYRGQAICEFDGLDGEVFIIDEKNIAYKEPTKVEQEIEVNGRKYRLVE